MSLTKPLYPNALVVLDLRGPGGNAFVILGQVKRALHEAGVSTNEQDRFMDEATSDDYDHLLDTVRCWVSAAKVDGDRIVTL